MEQRMEFRRVVSYTVGRVRLRWRSLRGRLAAIDWLVIPPAQSDVHSPATTGEAVTALFTAWMRTVSVWSIVASLVLIVIWIAQRLFTGE